MEKTWSEQILEQLTNEEKAALLGGCYRETVPPPDGCFPGNERVGLPRLNLADGPLGVHWFTDASTAYPASIALAATFDEELAYRAGKAIGTDCKTAGVHILLAPGVNLYRSPLCGRNFEYFGEDPELSGKIAAAYIRGVQSCGVSATVKHYAANNQEYDRHHISSDVDERTLREVYLRPFEIAVKEGNPGCLMTSYNPVNGQHASENHWLIETVLRGEWGFEGLVMSDWFSVYSTAQSLNSGLDIEMPYAIFLTEEKVLPLLESGVLSQQTLDTRVLKRLQLMERFGWTDLPKREDKNITIRNPETEAAALEVARNGSVLIENKDSFLPVQPDSIRKIAVLGHHADRAVISGGGSAYCEPHEAVTLKAALQQVYGGSAEVTSVPMLDLARGPVAWSACSFRTPDNEPGLKAEYFYNNRLEGEPTFVRTDERIDFEWLHMLPPAPGVDDEYFSVRWSGCINVEQSEEFNFYANGENGVFEIRIDGKLLPEIHGGEPQVIFLEQGLREIVITYRKLKADRVICRVGFEPARCSLVDYERGLEVARASDLVVVAAGFIDSTESENMDRSFALDERVDRLICDAAAANPNTAVVLYSGGAVDVAAWIDSVKAVLCIWYPGQNGTVAAAEILAGKTNPSGKLPFTWEERLEDRGSYSCYHDTDGDGRVAYLDGVFTGYRHFDRSGIAPRYPFGHGLSYAKFHYDNLSVTVTKDGLEVGFDLENVGVCAGAESALIFVGDEHASQPRPLRELKAMRKVYLEPGERQQVFVKLPLRALAFWNPGVRKWVIEAGGFAVSVGSNAATLSLQASVVWTEDAFVNA